MSCNGPCASKAKGLTQNFGVDREFKQWNDWKGIANAVTAAHSAGRLPWVSFKPPGGGQTGWQGIASGKYDAELKSLATQLKAVDDKPIWLTFHHEPADSGSGAAWASAYVHIYDVLKAQGALSNTLFLPIMSDWLFDPRNPADPRTWLTNAVLKRAPVVGVDAYENTSGLTLADRLPRVLTWLDSAGFPNSMVAVGETGATDYYKGTTAVKWLNASLAWCAAHTNDVAAVSYFNSTANTRSGVYWPLDESSAKMQAYNTWLSNAVTRN
jgi:hypothetical protein